MATEVMVHDSTLSPARTAHRRTLRMRAAAAFNRLREQFAEWKRNHFPSPPDDEDDGWWTVKKAEEFAAEQRRTQPPAQQRAHEQGPANMPSDPHGVAGTHNFNVPHAHPPFARPSATNGHVLDRIQILIVELRANPNLTATQAAAALYPLNQELSRIAAAEQNRPRRSARNAVESAQIGQNLAAAVAVPGVNVDEVVPAAAAEIVARALHASDPEPTGVIPVITPDMEDPRSLGHDPVDALAESGASPIHSEHTATIPAIPEPRTEFVGGQPAQVVPEVPWSMDDDTHAAESDAVAESGGSLAELDAERDDEAQKVAASDDEAMTGVAQ